MESETQLSAKAQETRQRIFDVAVRLFMEKGYEATTMRDIAKAADSSLGLIYRYFESKDMIVMEVYRQLIQQTTVWIEAMPSGNVAERFDTIMRQVLAEVTPYRTAWQGIFGGAMNPNSPIGVLGDGTRGLREAMGGVFLRLVMEASDAPKKSEQATALGALLYVMHLLVLLFWISDRSEGTRVTYQLLDFTKEGLSFIRGALVLPPVSKGLTRLAGIMGQVFGGVTPATPL